ncbi:MAG: pentapeptide repeat-containing protein [Pleurocapsa minor HA4230-MV1]|jgi:uncharacterized protein YjbI with pentapeptide repeats|nr:pentapeptide repeat-containing protein [Pleurocapsa minor HA4230-MV1]
MDREELLKRYAAGERDFTGVDLSGANLMEVALEDIIFENAILRGTKFKWSLLDRAIFRNANLENANFMLAHLEGADFRGANLRNCIIVETTLIRANFKGAIGAGYVPAGGYTYKTILPDGSIDTCSDPGRDRAIAEGRTGFWDSE